MKRFLICVMYFLLSSRALYAEPHAESHDHGAQIFHSFRLETDLGAARDGTVNRWELKGWIGTDEDKLWLQSEGEILEGRTTESAEFWALYSRNVSTFWDLQLGVRHDEKPHAIQYAVLGVNGLAPYFIETEAHLFVSERGDVSARTRFEHDVLFTQQLITQPYLELTANAQDIETEKQGAGFTQAIVGLQTRYEVTRAFAPYLELNYHTALGETSVRKQKAHENREDAMAGVGVRLQF